MRCPRCDNDSYDAWTEKCENCGMVSPENEHNTVDHLQAATDHLEAANHMLERQGDGSAYVGEEYMNQCLYALKELAETQKNND